MPQGRYQLRVGARDMNGGKLGTVFSDVVVPDFSSEPLMLSGLLISSTGAVDMLTAQRDAQAERLLGAPPSARRTFTQRETLRVLVEIYDNLPAHENRQVELHSRLIDESGRDVFSSRSHLPNGPGSEPAWSALGQVSQIPLSSIAAGRYLLRVEAAHRTDARPAFSETVIRVTPDGE